MSSKKLLIGEKMNDLKNSIKLHPFLFAIFPIVFFFSLNSQEIQFLDALILITIFSVLTLGITLFFSYFVKNKESVGIVISIGFILFFTYGHVFNLITNTMEIGQSILLGIFITIFVVSIFILTKTKKKLNNISKIANVIGITLIIISASNLLLDNFQGNYSLDLVQISPKQSDIIDVQNTIYPDVYYIVLDAYSGQEMLMDELGFDNKEFLTFLDTNNFHVIKNSQSNYAQTYFSLPSVLNMKHLECDESFDGCINRGTTFEMIQNNDVMDRFKKEGYVIINTYSGWKPTSDFELANQNLCSKYYTNFINTELTTAIFSNSILNPAYVFLFEDDKREQIQCIFSQIKKVSVSYEQPIFVFSHIHVPHYPYVFDENGEPTSPERLEMGWEGEEDDKEGYLGQLKFANKMMNEVITEIKRDSKISPIIIIQGDHGYKAKIDDASNPTDQELRVRFSNLNAYHIPGKDFSGFEDTTPVNTFRIIFNELFNDNLKMEENSSYWFHEKSPAYFDDITSILKK